MTGDDYCNSLRARYFELQTRLQEAHIAGEDSEKINMLALQVSNMAYAMSYCRGMPGSTQPQAQQPAAIKSSSPGQATPVPPTSYVGQGSQKQQPAFGMAAAQKKPPALGGAGFRQY